MKRISFVLLFLLFASTTFSQDSAKLKSEEIVSWLQEKSVAIKHAEAGSGFSDLQLLKKILKDVRVVGLGENTHGTKEFFQLKHRLLEFFVREMGFTAFAIEGGYGSCEPINNYVLNGEGDLSSVLTAQGYVLWDMEELATMIKWMRTYNQSVPDNKKVAFYGIDFMYNEPAREQVLAYLKKHSVQLAPVADSLFLVLSLQEKQWGREKDKNLLSNARLKLQDLIATLTEQKNKLTAVSSEKEFTQIVKYVQVMEQWFMLHLTDASDTTSTTNMKRSQAMANNLLYLMEKEKPDSKFVVWAHNVHTGDGHSETAEANMGHVLKNKLGDGYYGVAFEFNQGSYQSRLRSGGILGNLKAVPVAPAPHGYLASYLSRAKKNILFLNLCDSVQNPIVNQWLSQPQKIRSFGWFNDNTSDINVYLKARYDGIIFVEHTAATRPTKNAVVTVSKGEGL